jgi:hypothetical protein
MEFNLTTKHLADSIAKMEQQVEESKSDLSVTIPIKDSKEIKNLPDNEAKKSAMTPLIGAPNK